MRINIILPAAVTLALAATTGAFAQTSKYDPTGDHLYSFGAQTPAPAARHTRAEHASEFRSQAQPAQWQTNVQYDRTGDHLYSFGPASR